MVGECKHDTAPLNFPINLMFVASFKCNLSTQNLLFRTKRTCTLIP